MVVDCQGLEDLAEAEAGKIAFEHVLSVSAVGDGSETYLGRDVLSNELLIVPKTSTRLPRCRTSIAVKALWQGGCRRRKPHRKLAHKFFGLIRFA